ncbi:hypothetical protein NM208_g5839 [Fusarium decemcellulare]|uniref:Uncharacterized protein n=1 Tax=Fusarium decemcellulare TaxID=57161 RepID=A0ACC1SFE0_9HYPO|nr:hypothetical protein NM208_g5839 [Fusarium decemcellulare]
MPGSAVAGERGVPWGASRPRRLHRRPWSLDKRLSLHPTAVANRIRCRNYGHAIRGAQGTIEPKSAMIATLLVRSIAPGDVFGVPDAVAIVTSPRELNRDKHTEGQKTKLASGRDTTLDEAKTTETLVKLQTRTLDDSLKVANASLLSTLVRLPIDHEMEALVKVRLVCT